MLQDGYRFRIEDLLGADTLNRYLESLNGLSRPGVLKVKAEAAAYVVAHAASPIFEQQAIKFNKEQQSMKRTGAIREEAGL